MPSTYSPDLRIELIANGEQSGTWGTTTNNNLGTLIEDAISGAATISVIATNQALTAANGAADEARCAALILTTTTGAPFNIFAPPVTKLYVIYNASAYNAVIYCSTVLGNTTAAGAGYDLPAGKTVFIRSNGTAFTGAVTHTDTLTLGSALGVSSGGLGLTSIAARSIPVANVANTYTTVTPAASQSVRINASNTAWEAFTPGTVTSIVGGTGLSGGTITTSGTLALATAYGDTINPYASKTANFFLAAPDGTAGVPSFRALTTTDLPTIPVSKGGTGQTSYTDGQLLIGNSTGNTLTKATLTAGSGITITNGSGAITIATTGTSGVTAVTASSPLASSGGTAPNISLSGTVGVANGGTGLTSTPSNGQIDIGNGSGFTRTTLNAGSGISITNGAGAITIAATGGAVSSVTGSGAISASPTTGSVVVSVADASSGASGVVNTSTQTFAGNKTFNGSVNVNGIVSTTGAYNFTALNESIYGSSGAVSVSVGGAGRTTVTTAAYTPFTDGLITLGTGSVRWGQIYSTSGTINTSDANSKQDIADLDEAEKRVAVRIKGLIKKFRFKDAVAKKGSQARIHVGVIAQEVRDAFTAEGLDANHYGVFCSDTWWEKEEEVEYKPAAEMRKKVVVYDAPVEGGVQKTRLGVRYDELLAFVIAAM